MSDCAFCSIAEGTIRACIVYQDADVIAFMDKNPINVGHVLIIPKVHEEHFQNVADDIYSKVTLIAKRVAKAVNSLYAPKKVAFAVAGFDVPHAHLHVFPIYDYHDLTSRHYLEGTLKKPVDGELENEAARLGQALESLNPLTNP